MDPYHRESQVPPILQGDFAVPPPESSWPRVLGIISIVFGSLGLLINLWSAVAPFFMDAMAQMMPQDPASQASLQAQKDYIPYTVLVSLLCVIGSIMLLTGGIGLCRRARWGVKVTKIWIPWRIVCAVVSAIHGYVVMEATIKAMAQQSNPAPYSGMVQSMGVVAIVIGLVWGCAYPLFLLIWFSRAKVRDEVSSWA